MYANRFQEADLVLCPVDVQMVAGPVAGLGDLPDTTDDLETLEQALQVTDQTQARGGIINGSELRSLPHREVAVRRPEMAYEQGYLPVAESKYLTRNELLIAAKSVQTKAGKPSLNGVPPPVRESIR